MADACPPCLRDEVFDALASRRGDHVDVTTRGLLRHVDGGIALVGIDAAGEEAICFDPLDRTIYRIPVSPVGVHVGRASVEWNHVDDPGSWVNANHADLAWIHPRYRDRAVDTIDVWTYQPIVPSGAMTVHKETP